MDWSDELIRTGGESSRIAKHAHVPMQSGSDAVLRRMHRKYRPWHYREKILKIRSAMPAAAIGADVMVGFPGETESGVWRDAAHGRRAAVYVLARLHIFSPSLERRRRAGPGRFP
jgi:tRNA A37 methylthiotransferase MiaB